MDETRRAYARDTEARTLADVIPAPTSSSACRPAACSSPTWSQDDGAAAAHPGAGQPGSRRSCRRTSRRCARRRIIATGRSDYPNQVNNVLCFPFIFRGALDVGATTINDEMELAAVRAIADLAQAEQSDEVASPTAPKACASVPST
jgi:malate dehydrogenase (oxaloacetate-decarboxylating)(NADP+)